MREEQRKAEYFNRAGNLAKTWAMSYLGVSRLDPEANADLDIIICDVLERCWQYGRRLSVA